MTVAIAAPMAPCFGISSMFKAIFKTAVKKGINVIAHLLLFKKRS